MNKTLKDKLEEIRNNLIEVTIKRLTSKNTSDEYDKAYNDFPRVMLSLFEEMGESLIGENVWKDPSGDVSMQKLPYERDKIIYQNELRSEQKAKLKKLLGK